MLTICAVVVPLVLFCSWRQRMSRRLAIPLNDSLPRPVSTVCVPGLGVPPELNAVSVFHVAMRTCAGAIAGSDAQQSAKAVAEESLINACSRAAVQEVAGTSRGLYGNRRGFVPFRDGANGKPTADPWALRVKLHKSVRLDGVDSSSRRAGSLAGGRRD